ncbi:GNAT family N-acetyltransferase [Cryptosporangium sp. NPDC048952]|uniref:GNAT family N-acetyltransferase n=1 Tax=Cryptosporangium sp. NPDC048952 TaxID=3363961 RepID=UPI0037246889
MISVAEIAAAKRIPPARIKDLELERIAALGWRGLDNDQIGGWQLRAAGGWTGRANSVLPLGDPGVPLDEALAFVTSWYAERGLPPQFQLPLPAATRLARSLEERGWRDQRGAIVLTAETKNLRLPAKDLPPVTITDEPDADWLAAYHYRGNALPDVAIAVLKNATAPGFASVRADGTTIAICRLSVDEGWVGVTAVEVDPAHRRRGLATHLLAGALDWAKADHVYLQTEPDNTVALAMYEKLGFERHHVYRYYA